MPDDAIRNELLVLEKRYWTAILEKDSATAAALSVAIPAVFAYNIFAARLNRIEGELESFGSELIALMVREGMI